MGLGGQIAVSDETRTLKGGSKTGADKETPLFKGDRRH